MGPSHSPNESTEPLLSVSPEDRGGYPSFAPLSSRRAGVACPSSDESMNRDVLINCTSFSDSDHDGCCCGTLDSPTGGPVQTDDLPPDFAKCLVAFIFYIFSFLFICSCVIIANDRLPRADPELKDLVLDTVPVVKSAGAVCELIMISQTVALVLLVLHHKHRFVIMRRVFFILGLLFLIRGLCIIVTTMTMPDPEHTHCVPKSKSFSEKLSRIILVMSTMGMNILHGDMCGTYIFSGHTLVLTVQYLIFFQYTPKCLWPLRLATLILGSVAACSILVAHNHYTIDLLVAYWVTTRMWWTYHTLAISPTFRKPSGLYTLISESSYSTEETHTATNTEVILDISRVFWFRPMAWLEKNALRPVPNELESTALVSRKFCKWLMNLLRMSGH